LDVVRYFFAAPEQQHQINLIGDREQIRVSLFSQSGIQVRVYRDNPISY
jgi:hypothetical protein